MLSDLNDKDFTATQINMQIAAAVGGYIIVWLVLYTKIFFMMKSIKRLTY